MSAQLAHSEPRRIKATHRRRPKIASGRFVQRYDDPQVGRFLSIDPELVNTETGVHFSRYVYAESNPYKFTDPDGRCATLCTAAVGAVAGGLIGGGIELASQIASGNFDRRALLVETGKGAFVGGMIGLTGGLAAGNAGLGVAAKTGSVAFAGGMSGSTAHVVGEVAKGKGVPSLKQTALVGAATALGGAAGSRLGPGVASLTTTAIPKYSAYPIAANGSGRIHYMINIPAETIQRPVTAEVLKSVAEGAISEPMVKTASNQ